MKLTKAIEILETFTTHTGFSHPVDFENAVKLGGEALKVFVRRRKAHADACTGLLPGETKE